MLFYILIFCLQVGYKCRINRWVTVERTSPINAGDVHKGFNSRQTRNEKLVWVSSVQNQIKRTNICLDVQFKDKREAFQMDFGWSFFASSNLVSCTYLLPNYSLYILERSIQKLQNNLNSRKQSTIFHPLIFCYIKVNIWTTTWKHV